MLNGDDELLVTLRGTAPMQTIFFGKESHNDYTAEHLGSDGTSHIQCLLRTPTMSREVEIPALGEYMLYPTLTATAVAEYFELTPDQIEEGIRNFVPTRMRMNIIGRGDGITILDDTYNANPQAMRAAIQVLTDSLGQRKIAILGDMFELGHFAPALHRSVGECLGKARVDCLVAVGELSADIADAARNTGVLNVFHCLTIEEAKPIAEKMLEPDCTVLIKASRGMGLEQLTAHLVAVTKDET